MPKLFTHSPPSSATIRGRIAEAQAEVARANYAWRTATAEAEAAAKAQDAGDAEADAAVISAFEEQVKAARAIQSAIKSYVQG